MVIRWRLALAVGGGFVGHTFLLAGSASVSDKGHFSSIFGGLVLGTSPSAGVRLCGCLSLIMSV